MKWPFAPVIKWFFGTAFIMVIAISTGYFAQSSHAASAKKIEGNVQIGFYDLMSLRKEVYDSNMKTVNDSILTTITSPDDNQFVLKGKFTRVGANNGQIFFSWTPIYFSTTRKGLMIDGMVDLLLHVDVWMEPLRLNGQRLVVGQSGMIFLYQLP